MKLLLDTHAFLWWLDDPTQLTDRARVAIANPRNFVFVSPVSIIEIAIKEARGKLTTKRPPELQIESCRFHPLPLTIAHAAALKTLPSIHNDPFDRLLLAQAQVEGMTIATRDSEFPKYGVPVLAA